MAIYLACITSCTPGINKPSHPADTYNHAEEAAPEEALQEVTTFVPPPNI